MILPVVTFPIGIRVKMVLKFFVAESNVLDVVRLVRTKMEWTELTKSMQFGVRQPATWSSPLSGDPVITPPAVSAKKLVFVGVKPSSRVIVLASVGPHLKRTWMSGV